MIVFRKLKLALKEYNHDNQTDLSLHQFFVEILRYSEEDYNEFLIAKHTHKKPSGESKRTNRIPYIPNEIGDRENPEYQKYHDMVLSFREYMCNKELRPEGDEKKTMRTFMKYAYNLEGNDALIEMRKIENIVYKGKKSIKEKRNKRREQRQNYFNERLGL